MLSFDEVASAIHPEKLSLIAIDGLPCSGKSTLADRLCARFGLGFVGFDDFFLPHEQWPRSIGPAFPFPFFRVDEFRGVVRALKVAGRARYRPYDWSARRIGEAIEIVRDRAIVVEGCSVLDPTIADLYDFKLFVESDRATVMDARTARDGTVDDENWRTLYLPSVDAYLRTDPRRRADLIVAGRGAINT